MKLDTITIPEAFFQVEYFAPCLKRISKASTYMEHSNEGITYFFRIKNKFLSACKDVEILLILAEVYSYRTHRLPEIKRLED